MIDFSRSGRMISASKSSYKMLHPNDVVCFNANLVTEGKGKVWWGDLNLTLDRPELDRLARELNEPVYVLRELDCRFDAEQKPQLDLAVMTFAPAT